MIAPDERARLARFLARHALPPRDAVARQVERWRGMTIEELGRELDACCQDVADLMDSFAPGERARILEAREPPHPSYAGIMARLLAERAAGPG